MVLSMAVTLISEGSEIDRIQDALALPNETEAIIAVGDIVYSQSGGWTEAERVFVLVENVEREVNNGGFDQFFDNSSGDNAHESHQALLTMGAANTPRRCSRKR